MPTQRDTHCTVKMQVHLHTKITHGNSNLESYTETHCEHSNLVIPLQSGDNENKGDNYTHGVNSKLITYNDTGDIMITPDNSNLAHKTTLHCDNANTLI